MRTIMLLLTAVISFVVWDGFANNGKYVNAMAKDVSSTRLVRISF